MKFTYTIDYQNKQQRTITVVYQPEDPRALGTVQVIGYSDQDTDETIRERILQRAPIEVWKAAIMNKDTNFTTGKFEADSKEVLEVRKRYEYVPTLEDRRAAKYQDLSAWKTEIESKGLEYRFGEVLDVVQTRAQDLVNLIDLNTQATYAHTQGVTDPILEFRAGSNTHYSMTPAQMLEMLATVAAFRFDLQKVVWHWKVEIAKAESIDDLEAISFDTEV